MEDLTQITAVPLKEFQAVQLPAVNVIVSPVQIEPGLLHAQQFPVLSYEIFRRGLYLFIVAVMGKRVFRRQGAGGNSRP